MSKTIDYTDLEAHLKNQLSPKRYLHSLGVAQTCLELDQHYREHLGQRQLYISGLLHDMAREWPKEALVAYAQEHELPLLPEEAESPVLLHAPVAAHILEKLGYEQAVHVAVRYHTLGSCNMGRLGLVLYIADFLEPNRTHLDAQERASLLAQSSLETVCMRVIERERTYQMTKGRSIAQSSEELYAFLAQGGIL
ncbi:MAG: bis(5'-nucleosyl)-tetraphosphatase (symmetrical) YqeK [Sphaerochaeta sp.]|jgi:predicted HD superfamily hydrolase involved in NAD metabolism|uniref:bis(5'-nucleosyl)-tetraphosphatase (symmetrical) YqeK n=1 Tax=Sphaerochaeta sp. TaxID=1972642 RepID=UPI002FC6549D